MRKKIKAEKLPAANRLAQSFMYKCLPSVLPETRSRNKQSYKIQLSRIFQHSLTIQMRSPDQSHSDIIGTAGFDLQVYIIKHLDRCNSVDIFFSLSGHACFYGKLSNNEHRKLEVLMPVSLVSIFYGLSSVNLALFGRIVNDKLVVDITLNPSFIWDQLHFKPTCISETQYQKIMSFLKWSGSKIKEEQSHGMEIPKDFPLPLTLSVEELNIPVLTHDIESSEEFKKSLELIYDLVQESNISNAYKWNDLSILQPSAMKATLHPYQLEAVRWMIYRELEKSKDVIDPTWFSSYFLHFNENLFFSTVTGNFSRNLPSDFGKPCCGGILADEMGLGKTVEVLSLILHRPYPQDMTVQPLERFGKRFCNQKISLFKIPSEKLESGGKMDGESTEQEDNYNDEVMSNSSSVCTLPHSVFCICGAIDIGRIYEVSAPIYCDVCDSGFYQHVECVGFAPTVVVDGKSYEVNYICPLCWKNLRVHSKATLIIAPDHILPQWKDEIEKHVDKSSNLSYMVSFWLIVHKATSSCRLKITVVTEV
ncbi:unnamed protein product [Rodentolepis nana]|uniref:SNF2-rel_dom domain-containing protein n=1 Tax=Rodentolepis nana TaxID=102285 RepID=A0A0R3TU55_RODNA|nr:unnamed protein product [Rodentolepis nana]